LGELWRRERVDESRGGRGMQRPAPNFLRMQTRPSEAGTNSFG
jgi:hypothetical protein